MYIPIDPAAKPFIIGFGDARWTSHRKAHHPAHIHAPSWIHTRHSIAHGVQLALLEPSLSFLNRRILIWENVLYDSSIVFNQVGAVK